VLVAISHQLSAISFLSDPNSVGALGGVVHEGYRSPLLMADC
jgi:hypothetical protein